VRLDRAIAGRMNPASVTGNPLYRERRLSAQDGLSLYYRDYGPSHGGRLPVLCLPGLTRNSADFHRLALHLSGQRRVIAPDLRGRGESAHDPDWRNYTPATYLSDLRHLLASAGLHRACIVGSSFGGLLAMGLALVMPSAVAGVVLNDVSPDIPPPTAERILLNIGTDTPQDDIAAAIAFLRDRHGAEWPRAVDEDWAAWADAAFRPGPDGRLHVSWDTRLARAVSATGVPDGGLWAMFRGLYGFPCLAIRGALSDMVTAEALNRMAERHPDMATLTVDGVGHMPSLAEPESRTAIDDFLYRLDRTEERPARLSPGPA